VTTTGITSAAVAEQEPPYAEPFRTVIALAFCGTFVATVALLTASGVVSSLLDSGEQRPDADS
jgi:hypothetical protein